MGISVNHKLAEIFGEIADFLELKGENPFKVRAYQKAARTLEGFSLSVADMSHAELLHTPDDFQHNMGWAVAVARRAGLEAQTILNTRPLAGR